MRAPPPLNKLVWLAPSLFVEGSRVDSNGEQTRTHFCSSSSLEPARRTAASSLASANIYLDPDWLRNAKKVFLIKGMK